MTRHAWRYSAPSAQHCTRAASAISSAMPSSATNWMSVWRRNYLVWKKLAIASMFGNLADPMIYLFGLGLGLGLMVGRVDGVSYIAFLAAGTVASSVMMSASFEVDVLRLFAHARAAHVGGDHAHAAHARRYRARRGDLGGEQVGALGRRDHAGRGRVRVREFSVDAARAARDRADRPGVREHAR